MSTTSKSKHYVQSIFPILLTARVYALALCIFTLFRLLLFAAQVIGDADFAASQAGWHNVFKAFVMGLRFDLVISGYIMLLPFVALSVMYIINRPAKWGFVVLRWWIFTLFALSFAICAADIPYFGQFFSRFTVAAFQWMDSPAFVVKMIAQELRYLVFLLLLAVVLVVFRYLLKRQLAYPVQASVHSGGRWPYRLAQGASLLLVLLLMAVSIRGRIAQKSPIRIGTAYFCSDPFLNQLGLNPVFTFIKSMSSSSSPKKLQLMDSEEAIQRVRQHLAITDCSSSFPLLRRVDTVAEKKYNVVVVIMESMSAALMSRYGNTKNLTPFLDSLALHGYSFDKTYSAGIHTYNGIFSTLFSFPALFKYHPMKDVSMQRHNGMAWALREHGYSTIFFTTHDGQFDNVEGFLRINYFEEVVSQKNYPRKEVKSALGVPDDYMFRFAVPQLSKLHDKGQPFFAVFMTASNHSPIIVPEYFTPNASVLSAQVVEYSDWSLRQLVDLSAKEAWFDSTLFVFVADHGGAYTPVYEMPLNYHHSPFIVYAPKILKAPQAFDMLTAQIDVFPTVMGLLSLPYINNTLGVDVLAQPRPYVYFCADNKYGVLDGEYFLIAKESGEEALYRYADKSTENVIGEHRERADAMRDYALSNMQTYQHILNNKELLFADMAK
ncbi:MAG: LTA synthase family protein [Prevotellaceae bacterium]|jgi:phosphoglycerol transferase MdoB-like AlkP superfamily enzyme|nr:LTA synthase family protein [Prevotellaceae bacterium]